MNTEFSFTQEEKNCQSSCGFACLVWFGLKFRDVIDAFSPLLSPASITNLGGLPGGCVFSAAEM